MAIDCDWLKLLQVTHKASCLHSYYQTALSAPWLYLQLPDNRLCHTEQFLLCATCTNKPIEDDAVVSRQNE